MARNKAYFGLSKLESTTPSTIATRQQVSISLYVAASPHVHQWYSGRNTETVTRSWKDGMDHTIDTTVGHLASLHWHRACGL